MGEDKNFFNKAYGLLGHQIPLVSKTSRALHEKMQEMREDLEGYDLEEFNIYFFFLSASVLIGDRIGSEVSALRGELTKCRPIQVGESDISELSDQTGLDGLLSDYVKFVSDFADEEGALFDLRYASLVLGQAVNDGVYSWIIGEGGPPVGLEGRGDDEELDFDYWLSGFNSGDV